MRLFLFMFVLSCLPLPALAQLESNFRNGGGIIIGESADDCNAAAKGALRYNDTSKRFEGCNGVDGWSPLAQSSPQLGTPMYATTYIASSLTQYNNDLENTMLAWHSGNTSDSNYIHWRNTCHVGDNGVISQDNLHYYCGRFLCLKKTGQMPHISEVGDYCNEGGQAVCNGGHFYFSWKCLTTQ